jgi:serine/threonine protein kinase
MLEVGQILRKRYQLRQKLGHYAGRQTWLAQDLLMGSDMVIVKLLTFGDQVQWDDLKLFEREANTLKNLNHSRIPKYRDSFSIDNSILWFCLIQEYIPGYSLRQLLEKGRKFTETEVREIASSILEILGYLHELSPAVLHRDIKPSNLVLGENGQIYLVDFGAVQDKASPQGTTITVVGTYGYAPIEQFGGRAVPASDLYSLGATLVHLLTGVSPGNLPQKNLKIQFSDRLSLSPQLVRWINILIEPDFSKRFKSARQAIENLNLLTSQSTSSVKFKRPSQSRVKIYRSKDILEIIIPNDNLDSFNYIHLYSDCGILEWLFLLAITGIHLIFNSPLILVFLWLIIWLLVVSPSLALYMLSFSLIILICGLFRKTRIRLSKQTILIEDKILISKFSTIELANAYILNIHQGVDNRGLNKYTRSIAIDYSNEPSSNEPSSNEPSSSETTNFITYKFGQDLTYRERKWLIQEIKEWLIRNS